MKSFLKDIWYFLCRYVLILISDQYFYKLTTWASYKRFGANYKGLNLKHPSTFNEKLNCLKLLDYYYDYSVFADKYAVREFVIQRIGREYLIPLLGVYNSAEEINFDILPQEFILKTNHGSGWNIICLDKGQLNLKKTKQKLNKWLKYNAYYLSREKQCKNIKPLILCEKLLQFNIYDYKFFCFKGEPFLVQVDIDRFTNHKRAFYNMMWEKQEFTFVYPMYESEIPKPFMFEEMKELAQKLSKDFIFSRIDLYYHDNRIYFGEITFFPEGGTGHFIPYEYDLIIGNYLTPWII